MRGLTTLALILPALAVAMPAAAQRGHGTPPPRAPQYNPPVYNHPGRDSGRVWQGNRWVSMPRHNGSMNGPRGGHRWGGNVGGRWYAGSRAPGGWGSYRRPSRGWTLPGYWMQSDFRVPDYLDYGLPAPPYGYFWSRYYDDAVLIDDRGSVWDSVSGIGWADADADADIGYGYGGASAAAAASASAGAGASYDRPPIATVDPDSSYYGDSYPAPYSPGGYAPPAAVAPPAVQYGGCPQGCPGYGNGYYQGGASAGYYAGGYYYPPATVTTIVIQSAPVVTTTTTETIEEVVTSYAPRRVVRKYRPRTKLRPRCGC